ncbi:AprI/Inh family metalloprotease inhibitor [Microvirga sp. 2MCAF38]|uniref:AprI/Inh family metalloprotease inhibitor n=1 Tax=Microvirga sp. 2MCAF38 TaxID=3232989 RepID=UPI003F9C4AFF
MRATPQSKTNATPPSPVFRAAGRGPTSFVGTWTIRPGTGASCKLNLSSVAALDLYKASISRCSTSALQDVNSWAIKNGNIVLYARGSVIARMASDGNSFRGVIEGTNVPLTISR